MEKLQFETCAFEFQTSHCQPCHFKFQYFACLLLTFATEAVAGILGFLYREKIDDEITNRLRDEIRTKYGVTIDATTDQVVDNLQIRLKCCGIVNFTDWADSKWQGKNTQLKVPLSCCKEGGNTTTCNSNDRFDPSKINQEVIP